MHELSIAMSIVDIVSKEAEAAGADHVAEVELDIGMFSGIEYHSLESALEVATRETIMEGTKFRINRIEPVAECSKCQHLFAPGRVFSSCPECGAMNSRLVKGKELQIKSLVVEHK
jgi:hydrogenase nickel incorporation protein HypA/HybF